MSTSTLSNTGLNPLDTPHKYISPPLFTISTSLPKSPEQAASYILVLSSASCSLHCSAHSLCCFTMRQEGSSLDLNNLPEEYAGKPQQAAAGVESSTTTAASSADTTRVKKKSSGGGGKDSDAGKVYECRFCSLKFCKSQALGGHMNRHRQERETETLNRARQLVFGNETLSAVGAAQMSFRDGNMGSTAPSTMLGGSGAGFRPGNGVAGGDQCLPFRPVHPRVSPQPPYHYLYSTTAPSMAAAVHPMSYPATTYPRQPSAAVVGDYVIGRAVSSGDALMQQQPRRGGFSCFGATPATANVQLPDNGSCNCSFGCGHNRNVNASS